MIGLLSLKGFSTPRMNDISFMTYDSFLNRLLSLHKLTNGAEFGINDSDT